MTVEPLPLRGRQDELAVIEDRLREVSAGTGGAIVIEGSAGVGKTKLVDASMQLATDLGFRAGRGVLEPYRTGPTELEGLFDALFEGPSPLADRRALDDSHASPEFMFWLIQDLQSVIEEAALQSPILICLDDLHWAGASCAVAIRQLGPRLASLPVAWILAFRPNQGLAPVREAKSELIDGGAAHINLGPLTREAVALVASDVLGAQPDDDLLQRTERMKGNPFLLVEFLRGLQDDSALKYDSGHAILVGDGQPGNQSEGIRGRLARLSTVAGRVATLASSLGLRFTLHDLGAMTSLSVGELVDPVTELLAADVFVEDGDRLTFRHDLIREAVRAGLPIPVRRGLDRQGADVLIARGALPTEVALQLAESAEPGDDVAIETVLKATQELALSDPAGAASLAERGLELTPERHPLRGALVSQRVLSLFAAGLAEEGKRFADAALRSTLPTVEEARVRLSVATMFDISPEVRAETARAGLALPDLEEYTDLTAWLWTALFHSLTVAGRTEEAIAIQPKAREAAYASSDEACWMAFELPESGIQYQLLEFDAALSTVVKAERRDHAGREDARARLVLIFRSWVLEVLDRTDEALEAVAGGAVAAQRDRQNWALRIFETTKGRQLLQVGNLAEAATALEGQFSVAEGHRVAGPLHAPAVVALGKLKIHTAEERDALEVAEIAKVMLTADAPCVSNQAMWYLAQLALSQGDAMAAHEWLCSKGHDERLSMFPLFPHEVTDDAERVRIAAAASDPELAEHSIALAERRAALNPQVRSCRAAAAHARGIWFEAAPDLEVAVDLYRDGPRPLAYASALEDLGRVRVGSGDTQSAVRSFDEALSVTTRVGAEWDSARIRGRLRRLGVRRSYAANTRPKTGWAALTEPEINVARLAAEGRTNRQIAAALFVSPHTVNTHLRHVFEKLGINSRVQLTRFVQEQSS
jgi:DNA-binding CsgD family transcriptional regulator/tetratricopeptide (TPR) repeat protein